MQGGIEIVQYTGADIQRIAVHLLDTLGLDDRQVMMMCNRLTSDARARRQTFKGATARMWRVEEGKWVNVKVAALHLSKHRRDKADAEAMIASANEGKTIEKEI